MDTQTYSAQPSVGGTRASLPEVLDSLRCPTCLSDDTNWQSNNGSTSLFGDNAKLICLNCSKEFSVHRGYLDLCPDYEERITPIQHALQFRPAIAVYDNIWRPFGYFITSARSFEDDLDRIAELMEPGKHRLVLDLACGPGNFTRSVARSGGDTVVVGLDLARQMIERAVELTRQQSVDNVYYLRGNARSLPFHSETFDGVICCGGLQIFTDHHQALAEISRVLKVEGEFVGQTIACPDTPPLWLRIADRIVRYTAFNIGDFKRQLRSLRLDVGDEERSKLSYIFRAKKVAAPAPPTPPPRPHLASPDRSGSLEDLISPKRRKVVHPI